MKHTLLWTIVGSFAGLAIALPVRAAGVEDDIIDWYDRQLYQIVQDQDEYYKELASSGYTGIRTPDGSPGYYSFGEHTDGIAAIYEATGREYYLQRLIDYSKRMIAAGKDNNGDGYLDYFHWMHDRSRAEQYDKWDYESPYNYGWHCYWNAMRTPARCARVGRLGPHYGKYKDDLDEIVAFLQKHVIEKNEDGDVGMTIEQALSQSQFTISGMHSHAGSVMVDTYLATGDEHVRQLAVRFAEKVKGGWVLFSNGSYAWCGNGGILIPRDHTGHTFELEGKQYAVQDTAHSIRVMRFAAIAHRAGLVVTDEDIRRLVNTFTLNLWRGDDEKLADYVNGADHPENPRPFSTITQWVRVGGFDRAAHQRLVDWTGGPRRPDKYWSDRIHYFGILALNLKLHTEGNGLEPWQPQGAE